MARIKIDIPEERLAEIQIPIRITDLNYGNHVGNDSLVSIIQEARVLFLAKGGFSELDVGGCGLIMSDLLVEYLHELFYGNQLTIGVYASDISKLSFDLYYEINTVRDNKTITAARAKTGMVCYDYSIKRVAVLPEKLRSFLTPNR